MELKNRLERVRKCFDSLSSEYFTDGMHFNNDQEYEWLKTEIQLIQAEALTRLSYKNW